MSVTVTNFTNSSFPFIFANDTCPIISNKIEGECQLLSGYYCPKVEHVAYETALDFYVESPYGDLPVPLDETTVNCTNQTSIGACPRGNYCPTYDTIYPCEVGYFCGLGFTAGTPCTLGALSCPTTSMQVQNFLGLFFPFAFFLAVWLYVYYYAEYYEYHKREDRQDRFANQSLEDRAVDELEDVQQRAATMAGNMGIFSDLPSAANDEESAKKIAAADMAASVSGGSASASGSGSGSSLTQEFKFAKVKRPLRISFSNLKLTLKANASSTLLNNVFGTIKPSNITALMGPSGAGKTTLLSLLRGQAHYANCSGTITVNSRVVGSLSEYRSNMAFVPQDDITYEELSVEDNILYSAMLFNRRGYTRASTPQLMAMVNRAEVMLGIDFIKHSVVGGSGVKGISGGQRKRVSIGMEMMKEAALFFLDEPTSGLDSATSISVLHCLKGLSLLGVNIVATIHQPRQEILDMLDNLILLAPGGRLAFFDNPRKLKSHFFQFGYVPSANCNIADFMMDCLAGFIVPEGQGSKPVKQIIAELCDWWETNTPIPEEHRIAQDALQLETDEELHLARNGSNAAMDSGSSKPSILAFVFANTAYVSGSRQKKLFYRIFNTIVMTAVVLLCTGLCVGFLLDPVILETVTGNPNLIQQAIVGQLVFGIFVTNTGLRLFAADELMRGREEEGGVWLLPLFMGKIGASYVEFFFYAFAFVSGYYSVLQSNSGFGNYWGLFLLLHLVFASLSNLIAIGVPGKLKDLVMLGVTVVLWLFGGVQPPYSILVTKIPIVGPVFNALSPFRWSFPVQIVMELNTYSQIYAETVDGVYEEYGYKADSVMFNSVMLVVYALVVNFLAYLLLVTKRDNYAVVRQWRTDWKAALAKCGCCGGGAGEWPLKRVTEAAEENTTMNEMLSGSDAAVATTERSGRQQSAELTSVVKGVN